MFEATPINGRVLLMNLYFHLLTRGGSIEHSSTSASLGDHASRKSRSYPANSVAG